MVSSVFPLVAFRAIHSLWFVVSSFEFTAFLLPAEVGSPDPLSHTSHRSCIDARIDLFLYLSKRIHHLNNRSEQLRLLCLSRQAH